MKTTKSPVKTFASDVQLNQATMVALELDKLLVKAAKQELDYGFGTLDNGREQGFTIFNRKNKRMASFAENRNSDDIVVYPGHIDDFTDEGTFKTDELYFAKRKYFPYGDAAGAAAFIFKHITR